MTEVAIGIGIGATFLAAGLGYVGYLLYKNPDANEEDNDLELKLLPFMGPISPVEGEDYHGSVLLGGTSRKSCRRSRKSCRRSRKSRRRIAKK